MSAPMSDAVLAESIAVWLRHGRNKASASVELNIARSSLQSRLACAARRGMIPPDGDTPAPGYIIKARSITTDADGKVTAPPPPVKLPEFTPVLVHTLPASLRSITDFPSDA